MSLWLSGIGVSRGIVIGRVVLAKVTGPEIPHYTIPQASLEAELARFQAATQQARAELRRVRERIPPHAPGEVAAIVDTHMLMLGDRTVSDGVAALIRERRCNAEWALKVHRNHLAGTFERMDDAYLRARRDDIEHVVARILRVLLQQNHSLAADDNARHGAILVARDITPADIVVLHQRHWLGFVTEYGGPLAHSAILARSLGIAAVVGLHQARRLLCDDEPLIIDGGSGGVLAAPDQRALAFYRRRQRQEQGRRRQLRKLRRQPARSSDGQTVRLLANIELPRDAQAAREAGADGVGLYRTEFLHMNREQAPDEAEQLAAYSRMIAAVSGPITIRTLDLGADKQARDHSLPVAGSNNPALGLRAIRLCLRDPAGFRVQLRAILRAALAGDVRIMLPMISGLQELQQARQLVEGVKTELQRQRLPFRADVPIGAMIEVPAAALAAPWLARHCDFFSIGTNDLIQYTLAIDRVDDEVNYLYDPLHPAVLQLIERTITSAAKAGIAVAMCGEMAGDTRYTRLLLGLGLTEFSMHPANILEIKQVIADSDVSRLKTLAHGLLTTDDTDAQQDLLMRINGQA